MKKYTQKYIRQLVYNGQAHDLTNLSFDEVNYFLNTHNVQKIGYSLGINGLNGGILQDMNTGELFVITKANSTLLQLF